MKVVAVVGSASGSGKTRLACAILTAFPGLGAVKISPRQLPPRVEWGPGEAGKDTARFAASGAGLVARIVGRREDVPGVWFRMQKRLEGLPGVVVEGAGALGLPVDLFTIHVADAGTLGDRPGRDRLLASAADLVVVVRAPGADRAAPHEDVVGRRSGVPVLAVAPDDETWAKASLVAAVGAFLSRPSRPSAGAAFDPAEGQGMHRGRGRW